MKVIVTSSLDGVHGALLIVHLKVYVVPATPEKVEVGLEGVVILPPAPETIVHNPDPTAGALPASVTDINPQVDDPV